MSLARPFIVTSFTSVTRATLCGLRFSSTATQTPTEGTAAVEEGTEAASEATIPATTLPASNEDVLQGISDLTVGEFETLINSAPKPTLNRDEIVLKKFQQLLKTYMNRDKLKREFMSSSSLLSRFPNLVPTNKNEPYSEAELAIRQRHHAQVMGRLGSQIKDVYKPHELITRPPRPNQITIEKLMACGAHLGHSTSLWNNATQPFIYGEYKGIHVIDMDKTVGYLKRAAKVVEGVSENGGLVLFLGLREGQLRAVKEAARRCNGYYVTHKWVPGTITNSLENPKPRQEVDMGDVATKRELSQDETREVIKPDLIVMLNPLESKVAVKEANQARIPTIGIVDTNCDPGMVTYAIPANDDSIRATNLICGVLGKAGELGYRRRLEKVHQYKEKLGVSEEEPLTGSETNERS
ncbi:DEKNAAC103625 [Brettanomyces naardenensis]|uniref:DEKNAAC103625 n=1 Tax=Brettanomyces naardenensis TaxID=13370 RepID=A0A448YP10_BRENA|nr:DEKNAAC103625 [Brettanomyces naardenensis]